MKCPKCGNWANGNIKATFARKVTRGAVKKGASTAIGTTVGSVIAPGVGTIIGAGIGIAVGALIEDNVKQASDVVEDIVFDNADFQFVCPNCGHQWEKSEEEIKEMIDSADTEDIEEENSDDDSYDLFFEEWQRYLDNLQDILESKKSVEKYIREIDDVIKETDDTFTKSCFLFLQAFCILQYTNVYNEQSLIKKGLKYARQAYNLYQDNENTLLRSLFMLLDEDMSTPDNYTSIFKYKFPSDLGNNNLVNTDYWKGAFDLVMQRKLYEIEYGIWGYADKVVAVMKRVIAESNDEQLRIIADNVLCFAYSLGECECSDNTMLEEDNDLAYGYALDAIKLWGDKIDYNENDEVHKRWRQCLEDLGYAYIRGFHVKQDFKKGLIYMERAALEYGSPSALSALGDHYMKGEDGFPVDYKKAFSYFIKLSEINSAYSDMAKLSIGKMYEDGLGRKVDYKEAMTWYKRAKNEASEGSYTIELAENAIRDLSLKMESSTSLPISQEDDNEQEYIDALKEYLSDGEISERERKMLDRVRKALGISIERAAELEEALKQPSLTDEEREYIEAYQEYLVDGSIDEKSRKRLDIFRKGLGLSAERASELENL